jgi:hypothetical protein
VAAAKPASPADAVAKPVMTAAAPTATPTPVAAEAPAGAAAASKGTNGAGSTGAAAAIRISGAAGIKPMFADIPFAPDGALTAHEWVFGAAGAAATEALGSSTIAATSPARVGAGAGATGSAAAAAARASPSLWETGVYDRFADTNGRAHDTHDIYKETPEGPRMHVRGPGATLEISTEMCEGPTGVRATTLGPEQPSARWRERWASYRPLASLHEREVARNRAALESLGGTWAPPLSSLRVCEEVEHAEDRGFGAAPAAASPAAFATTTSAASSAAAPVPLTALGAQLLASGVAATPLHLSVRMPYYVGVPAGWAAAAGGETGGLARGVGTDTCSAGTGTSLSAGAGAGKAGPVAAAHSNAPELGPASGSTACGTLSHVASVRAAAGDGAAAAGACGTAAATDAVSAVPVAQQASIDALNAEMQRRYAEALAIMMAPLPAAALPIAHTLAAGPSAREASSAAGSAVAGSAVVGSAAAASGLSGAGQASLPIPVPIPALYPVPLHLRAP